MSQKNYRIGILGTAKGPHVQALAEEYTKLGLEVILINPKRLTSVIPGRMTKEGNSGSLKDLDGLVVRSLPGGSLEQVIYRVNVLHHLEHLGLKVMNSAQVLEKTVDKFYTSALLAQAGLPVPKTIVTEEFEQALEAVRELGRVVVKPLFGSLGTGMVLVEDPDVAHRVFRALEMGRYVYYLQEFLPHDNEDYRLFVVGGEVISAMRRRGQNWKTNMAKGAVAEYIQPDSILSKLALETAQILGADYVGVDILISEGKPYLIEANGIPGWSGLQTVSPLNIAQVLADFTLKQIKKEAN